MLPLATQRFQISSTASLWRGCNIVIVRYGGSKFTVVKDLRGSDPVVE
jgi:hypothetical protein